MKPASSSRWRKSRRAAGSTACCCTAIWCSPSANPTIDVDRGTQSLSGGTRFRALPGTLPCDAASFGAHKFYGPKGAGFLYLRSGLPIDRIQFGGSHEGERRPGTENVPAIVGMAAAAEEALRDLPNEQEREASLRNELWRGHRTRFPRSSTERRAGAAPCQHTQCQFPRLYLGNASHGARSRGDLRLERLGLHGRLRGRLACPACDGPVAGARRFGHSLLVRQRNDRVRNRANGRGDRTHPATPKITGAARTRRNMLSFSQLEFSLAPSVVEKPPGRDSALEAVGPRPPPPAGRNHSGRAGSR